MAGLMQKFKDLWNPPEEEYGDYDYEEEQPEEGPARPRAEERQQQAASYRHSEPSSPHSSSSQNQGGKVVNLNPSAVQLQVVIFKPEHFGEETCSVADELLHGNTVVLNLEDAQKDISRRIIDFLSGVAYANGGKIKRVATNTFIITPYNVDLTGEDAMDETESNGAYF